MADQEQFERLKRSVGEWNQWREQQSKAQRLHLMQYYPCEMGLDEIEDTVHPRVWNDVPWADLTSISPKFWVDLSGADLSGADLYSANLYGANLCNADLSEANLHRANLTSTNLMNADLSRAILHRADLYRAVLISANLSEAELRYANLNMAVLHGANLQRADLTFANLHDAELKESDLSMSKLIGANLSWACLEKANCTNATIGGTQFDYLDLRGVIGLDTMQPLAPSTLGLDTIYLSHGQIPESFLRRTGAPETFITNMRALVASLSPIERSSCFIAYASPDKMLACRIHADLQASEVRCWFAPQDMRVGDEIRSRIDEAILLHDKLLLLLSEHSLQSTWVKHEVEAAFEKEEQQHRLVLFPIRLDDMVMQTSTAWAATLRRTRHIGDFTRWTDPQAYQQAFDRLLRDLKAET
ncbi:MAG TPA: toll/interleukin-1 receptor domain-containing protein [Ktedonobacteraceae bacterium]|nr:toll/interleukin-1 receptor domain-containing protein [Ktedonobacteraceae bacterium]